MEAKKAFEISIKTPPQVSMDIYFDMIREAAEKGEIELDIHLSIQAAHRLHELGYRVTGTGLKNTWNVSWNKSGL